MSFPLTEAAKRQTRPLRRPYGLLATQCFYAFLTSYFYLTIVTRDTRFLNPVPWDRLIYDLHFWFASGLAIIYLVSTIYAMYDRPWAWAICIARPISFAAVSIINFMGYFYEILYGQYRYDSFNMFFGVFFAFLYVNFGNVLILFLLYRNRRYLSAVFRPYAVRAAQARAAFENRTRARPGPSAVG